MCASGGPGEDELMAGCVVVCKGTGREGRITMVCARKARAREVPIQSFLKRDCVIWHVVELHVSSKKKLWME